MSRKRRSFGAAFKAKVALAACRGDKTTAQLASEYEVHAGQVTAWKKQLLAGATELFEDRRGKRPDESAADEQELYEQIGRLKMEVEWLKKNRPSSVEERRRWIEQDHPQLSVARQAEACLDAYFRFYAHQRIHQSLGYRTPAQVYAERD